MPLILLHPDDNVFIATQNVSEGAVLNLDGSTIEVKQSISLGHKIARRDLVTGDKVYRCGVPIGTMSQPAQAGAHVHLHNLASDYIATHSRETLGDKEA